MSRKAWIVIAVAVVLAVLVSYCGEISGALLYKAEKRNNAKNRERYEREREPVQRR